MTGARKLLGPPGGRTTSLIVLLLSVFAAVGLSIGYTAHTLHRSDQQWCALLRSLDQPLPASPAPSQRSRTISQQIHELRSRFGC